MNKEILGGSMNTFGPRSTEVDNPGDLPVDLVRVAYTPIYTTAGSAALAPANFNANDSFNVIPAKSFIKAAYIYVEDAFTSTSSATGIDAGLVRATDGSTEIDFDGLIDVTGVGAKANLTAGKWDFGDGPKIGTTSDTTYDAVLYANWAGGTDTLTGTGVLVVEYIPPIDHLLGAQT